MKTAYLKKKGGGARDDARYHAHPQPRGQRTLVTWDDLKKNTGVVGYNS